MIRAGQMRVVDKRFSDREIEHPPYQIGDVLVVAFETDGKTPPRPPDGWNMQCSDHNLIRDLWFGTFYRVATSAAEPCFVVPEGEGGFFTPIVIERAVIS